MNNGKAKHGKVIKDITGRRFGRLTVLRATGDTDAAHNTYWLCKCDCGNVTRVARQSLITGATRSCGCLRSEQSSKRMGDRNRAYAIMRKRGEM